MAGKLAQLQKMIMEFFKVTNCYLKA